MRRAATTAALTKLWFNGEVRALPGPIRGEGAFVMDGALYGYRVATGRPEAERLAHQAHRSIPPTGRSLPRSRAC